MKIFKLVLIFLGLTGLFTACNEDKDDEGTVNNKTEIQYSIVGLENQDLPNEWADAEEFGCTIKTTIDIVEYRGSEQIRTLRKTIYGVSGDRVSVSSKGVDNLRINYSVDVSLENVTADGIMSSTFNVNLSPNENNVILLSTHTGR